MAIAKRNCRCRWQRQYDAPVVQIPHPEDPIESLRQAATIACAHMCAPTGRRLPCRSHLPHRQLLHLFCVFRPTGSGRIFGQGAASRGVWRLAAEPELPIDQVVSVVPLLKPLGRQVRWQVGSYPYHTPATDAGTYCNRPLLQNSPQPPISRHSAGHARPLTESAAVRSCATEDGQALFVIRTLLATSTHPAALPVASHSHRTSAITSGSTSNDRRT